MTSENDEKFMRAALREASRGLGRTSPNPAVGALLVHRNKIVSRAYHQRAGLPHAEVTCLAGIKSHVLRQATLYVTLEPCSTVGQTGRCTDVIICSGVKRVVIGAIDENPRHHGRGVVALQKAGIKVVTGVLEGECARLNEAFNKWVRTGRPFVLAKCGMSLDGRLTRPRGESRWLTSAAARRDAHLLRHQVDAIIVGAETARADNPKLTVRGIRNAKQPWRVILTRSGRLPTRLHLLSDRFKERTLIYRNKSLGAVLRDLGRKKVTSVLIEGGGDILGQALDTRLIDKIHMYVAPLLTGGPVVAFAARGASTTQGSLRLRRVTFEKLADDVRVVGYPVPAEQTVPAG